jgi:hypothetical protein
MVLLHSVLIVDVKKFMAPATTTISIYYTSVNNVNSLYLQHKYSVFTALHFLVFAKFHFKNRLMSIRPC